MFTIEHVLGVVPVADIDAARAWYKALFGRDPDNNPMPVLVEWQVTEGGWVQVTEDPERAGSGMLNLAVTNLGEARTELAERGLEPGEVVDASKGVQLCALADRDGNRVTLIGNFRVVY